MKKIYTTLAFLLVACLTFAQTQEASPEETAQNPQNAISTTQNETNLRPVNSVAQNQIFHAGHSGHASCAAYDLNEAYYQSIGKLAEYHQSAMDGATNAINLNFPETSNPNEISVIFHVVYNPNNPAENVPYASILALFQELQDDYQLLNADAANARTGLGFIPADCDINFCLATQDPQGNPLTEIGVTRVSTTEDYYDHDGGEENKMKYSAQGGDDIWDRNKYLNVWICDITNGLNYGTAGYAYRPTPTLLPGASIDGIVIDYNIGFGSNVLTHEVGHYLGLDHTWGGSGSCGNDDGFTDTPNTIGPADQDPGFSCGLASYMTCGVEVQYENYMDYATGCTVMFTQEQANYMLSILQGIRGSLLLSPGCDPTNTPPNSAFTAMPIPTPPVIIPANGSVNLIDQSTNVPTSWTWTISGTQGVDWSYINSTNGASQDPQVEFYTPGLYDVTLTAANSYGADPTPASEIGYIQVATAATGITCDTLRNYNPNGPFNAVSWQAPSTGYVHGHSILSGNDTTFHMAEPYTATSTTDIRAIEFAPLRVSDGGGFIIWKVWNDNAGLPASTPLSQDTLYLADALEGFWNNLELNTPVTSITGTFWVGYELRYTNPLDTFALIGQIVTPGANSTWREGPGGWEDIPTTTGNAAGFHGLIDVLTSTGPAPDMDFTASDDEVCTGGDIMVNGSGSLNNIDYRWYVTDDPWVTTLEQSYTASNTFNFPYTAGNYNIYLFGDGSCVTRGVYLPISVYDQVSATVTPTATTCGNNNGSIAITNPLGGDLTTYYYSLDGVNYQTGSTFSNLAPGDYDVYVATFGTNCEATYTVNVGTSTAGTATSGPNSSICPGNSTSISASGGVSYSWYDGNTFIGSSATLSVSPTNTTQYTCEVTDGFGCLATAQVTVTVHDPIQPVITANGSTTICSGTTVDLSSSSATGNVWSTAETSSTITVGTAGSYTVTAPDINGCSSTSDAIVISVNAAPSISTGTVIDPNVCGSSSGSIQITGASSGNVSWSGTSSGTSGGPVSLPYIIPSLTAGSYNITLTDGNGCVSNLISQPLNDPNSPATPVITASGPTTFCIGDTVTLTSSYASGNTWTTAETSAAIQVSTTQTISVTYTDGFGCSSTSNSINIVVNPNPNPPTITPGGPTTFCDGGSVNLSSSQGTGNVWSTGETTQTITVSTSGTVDLTYTNTNGCSSDATPIVITVNSLPSVTLGALSDVCDYTSPFSITSGSPSGGTYSGNGITGNQFDPSSAGLGTHTITYEYTDGNGCINSAQQDIYVDACISVEEITHAGLFIYPNPTEDVINVEFSGNFDYEVVDARGRRILEGYGTDKVLLSMEFVETGVYFINITNEGKTLSTRIVKQ